MLLRHSNHRRTGQNRGHKILNSWIVAKSGPFACYNRGVSALTSNSAPSTDHLKKLIREVPDFPTSGINFDDVKDKTGSSEELNFLKCREKVAGRDVFSLIQY